MHVHGTSVHRRTQPGASVQSKTANTEGCSARVALAATRRFCQRCPYTKKPAPAAVYTWPPLPPTGLHECRKHPGTIPLQTHYPTLPSQHVHETSQASGKVNQQQRSSQPNAVDRRSPASCPATTPSTPPTTVQPPLLTLGAFLQSLHQHTHTNGHSTQHHS